MTLPNLNGIGRLTEDPALRFSASGTAVASVRLAFNSRKKDDSGNWVDDAVFYINGAVFGPHAENLVGSLQRGMEVMVTGRLKTESWEKDGQKHERPSLLIDSIGPSLRNATAKVEKAGGSGRGREEFQQARQQGGSQTDDPWASQAPAQGGWGQQSGGYSDEPPF